VFVAAVGVAVAGGEVPAVGVEAAVVGGTEAVLLVVTMGTDCNTADWMTKGLALSCLGGGLDRLTMMSDMACCAWAR